MTEPRTLWCVWSTVRWCMYGWSEQSWRLSCIDGATMVVLKEKRNIV